MNKQGKEEEKFQQFQDSVDDAWSCDGRMEKGEKVGGGEGIEVEVIEF